MSTANRELVFNRLLRAPRELVFDVWTDPEHLAQWYGPEGFSLTTHEMDLRPGGIWSFTMHGPDGRDYRNKVMFSEIERPERLVYRHLKDADTEPVGHEMSIDFLTEGEHTRLSMRLVFDSPEGMEMVAHKYGAVEGGSQTLNRLERLLAVLTHPLLEPRDNQIVSTRLFDIPQEQLFKAWSDPEVLARWWGKGIFDLRPGGRWCFTTYGPEGREYEIDCIFIAIAPPVQLIWRQLSAPECYVIVNFERELGKTRMVYKMIFNSAEECAHVRSCVIEGNERDFDRLEAELDAMVLA